MKAHWFLSRDDDLLELLEEQVSVTLRGVDAFVAWSNGELAQDRVLRDADSEAHRLRQRLHTQARDALSTPLDPADLYALSERFDTVLAGARRVVREAAVHDLLPDAALAKMASTVAEGVRLLAGAVALIVGEPERAAQGARVAVARAGDLERSYCDAMSAIVLDDTGGWPSRQELYRECVSLGDALISVAERIRYATADAGAGGTRAAADRS